MRAASILLASVATFAAIEGAVFHSPLYLWLLNPDASTGDVETILRNEWERPKSNAEVLGIGDSRMLLMPRIANQHTAETGYTYGTIATAGASQRSWYYMLRDTDPTARQYRAIVFALESYDDAERRSDEVDNDADLSYVVARLRLADLWEYSQSFQSLKQKWKAARGTLIKGLVYKRDFEDLLLHPRTRYQIAKRAHRDSFQWHYDYTGPAESMADYRVDWQARKVTAPPGADSLLVAKLQIRLLDPQMPETGHQGAYLKRWLGKIYEHYRGSPTKLIFLRLPRGGFVRPDQPRYNPQSSVRVLAMQPNVVLIDEHFFDSLERPELFRDELHLNGPGMEQFSVMITQEVSRILGPPR